MSVLNFIYCNTIDSTIFYLQLLGLILLIIFVFLSSANYFKKVPITLEVRKEGSSIIMKLVLYMHKIYSPNILYTMMWTF